MPGSHWVSLGFPYCLEEECNGWSSSNHSAEAESHSMRTRNLIANGFMGHHAILHFHLALHKLWYACRKFDQHLVFEAL